jgi:ubiquinone/menaquinone biosynthesis C-methylase UbiE
MEREDIKIQKNLFSKIPAGRGIAQLSYGYAKNWRLIWCLENIKKVFSEEARIVILEIGCGAGQYIKRIKLSFPNALCIGVDIEMNSLFWAKNNNTVESIVYIQADAMKLPFKPNSIDIVLAIDIYEHLPNFEKVIKATAHLLRKKEGFVYSAIILDGELTNYVGIFSKISANFVHYRKKYSGHITFLRYRKVINEFNKHFRILDKKYSMHLFGQIRDILLSLELKLGIDPFRNPKNFLERIYRRFCYALDIIASYESFILKHSKVFALLIHIFAKKMTTF